MERVSLAHGDGGQLANQLIKDLFIELFGHKEEAKLDAALFTLGGAEKIAITTDSFVIRPIFFPGGDIGKLAVTGTVNDLAVSGAVPLYLTVGFIIEEGFLITDLRKIVESIAKEAKNAQVKIIAGDTKVVEKGKAEGIYINTSGIGIVHKQKIHPESFTVGDSVIISGTVGDHAISILSARNELGIETDLASDCASLNHMIQDVLQSTEQVRIMRDPTRGGLATSLVEICEDFGVTIEIEEVLIPVKEQVKGACDLLGYEPIYLANEGKVLFIVNSDAEQHVLSILHQHKLGEDARVIGKVSEVINQANDDPKKINDNDVTKKGRLVLRTSLGSTRRLDRLAGILLPRIC